MIRKQGHVILQQRNGNLDFIKIVEFTLVPQKYNTFI